VKSFYVKRFSFVPSDNTPVSFISDAPKSWLVELSGDRHPRYEVVWKLTDKEPEAIVAEDWIGKKGIAAKGKKCAERGEVKTVRFIEPLVVDEPEEETPNQAGDDNGTPVSLNDNPVILSESEESAGETTTDLDEVPDLPGDIFDEPTLF